MKKGIKILLTIIIIATGLSLSACKDMKTDEEKEEITAMTDEQRDLLLELSINDESVKEGTLSEWQIEVLRQFDYAKEYLARKYPSHTFKIIRGCEYDIYRDYTDFSFIADDNKEKSYDMRIDIEKKDSGNVYMAIDDYYGTLLEEKYEKELLKVLQSSCIQCVAVKESMKNMDGEEVGETFDVNRIINEGFEITHRTRIFINGKDEMNPSTLVDQIQDIIKEKKIYGSYIVYVLEYIPEDCIEGNDFLEYVSNEGEDSIIIRETFQQFNHEGEE
ncbi:hypothetical protein [Anaerosporobacter sp.]